ncbi:hypothetical protein FOL47_005336 [Perkinsus chesapeaki]|uniref:Histone RNA hairpin-binding protein RNA-binding domain-containing protein n=1 Tax=Perkinsus chesapeaki TaxID=330153 RepID=A0A7J6LXZ1_PERCH|nr:hypothetical protein FOL47_005336 [Perkinsus chesapeaki]
MSSSLATAAVPQPSSSTALEGGTKLNWADMSSEEEDSFGKAMENLPKHAAGATIAPSKICWADYASDDSLSMPVPPINRRTVARGTTTFPKAAAPLDGQDSYLEPPADMSKLAAGVSALTTAPEESRPAGFGFLMSDAKIVIPEDSKGSVSGADFLSNLPGLEDSKRLAAKRLSSVSAQGELETASKFRKLNTGQRTPQNSHFIGVLFDDAYQDVAKGPSFFPDPNAKVTFDPIFGGDAPPTIQSFDSADDVKTPQTELRRRRPALRARRRTTGGAATKTPLSEVPATEEQWQARAEQRSKQIEIGKMTENYLAYRAAVTPSKRNPAVDPVTPNPKERISKRAFDAELKQWRKRLHSVEIPQDEGEDKQND